MSDRTEITNGEIRGCSPLDGRALDPVPVTPAAAVKEAVDRARAAQAEWARLPLADRVGPLKAAAKEMLRRRDEIVELLAAEAGKVPSEGLLTEAVGPLDYLKNWLGVIRDRVRPRRLPVSFLAFPGKSARVDLLPRGVVGYVAPWNYPLATFFRPVWPALLCGNAVVLKPSSQTPRCGAWFVEQCRRFLPADLVGLVQGPGELGSELVRAGIDALVFTGSVATGRRVLGLAAERLIPCSAELGGKDPAIVLADCDLDRTVAGIVYWAFHNAGQNCGAVERVYVESAIADEFVRRLAAFAATLRCGPGAPAAVDVSALNNPGQLALVEEHVRDAVDKGAKLYGGGRPAGPGLWYRPAVLDRCTHEMKAVTEETFGPVLPVIRVPDAERALALANDSDYGLTGSVWTTDLERGEELASRLAVGVAMVNNHAISGAWAFSPWSGVKDSGYGVANSAFALDTFVRPRLLLLDRNSKPDAWWYPADEDLLDMGERLADAQLNRFLRALKLPFLIARRVRSVLRAVRKSNPNP